MKTVSESWNVCAVDTFHAEVSVTVVTQYVNPAIFNDGRL
jgi:hypothetical protein